MTPYRSVPIEGRPLDPARARFGLAGAAAGSLACFIALAGMAFHPFGVIDAVLLFGGSAAMALMLAYSALDAPAGRGVLVASVTVFVLSFVPQLILHGLMGQWVWPVRYFAIAGIAGGLLLRLRRTRPGRYGALLRLAGVVSAWWGVQSAVALALPHGHQSARAELFARVLYLLLAAGLLDMRRWVGGVPMREPTRTAVDSAREIATTRLCLAIVSPLAALTALPYAWQSEWDVIASAEAVSIAITIALHVPWLLRQHARDAVAIVASASVVGLGLAWRAFDVRAVAASAAGTFAIASLAADVAVARFARSAKADAAARPAFMLSIAAFALHVANVVIIVVRVRGA